MIEATVCVPWRPSPSRIKPYECVRRYWEENFPEWPVITADSETDIFSLSQARNNAVRQAKTDIIVLCDADTIPPVESVKIAVADPVGICWPHKIWRLIPAEWADKPLEEFPAAPTLMEHLGGLGGCMVATTKEYWRLGGQPEEFCVDERTEILTSSGWAHYTNLRAGDIVLTLNHETGLSEWQPVQRVNVIPGVHEMVSIESKTHSSLTTMSHRWPVIKDWYVNQAGKKQFSRSRRDWTTTATFSRDDYVPIAARCADLPNEPKYTDALVEVVAWFWTEGSISRSSSGATIGQSMQVNPHKCELITSALTRVFGPPSSSLIKGRRPTGRTCSVEDCDNPTDSHGYCRSHAHRWRRYGDPLAGGAYRSRTKSSVTLPRPIQEIPRWTSSLSRNGRMMLFYLNAEAGKLMQSLAPDRIVTYEFLLSLTQAQLLLFIETSMLGDGHTRVGQYERTLAQKDRGAAEAFHFACILAGHATSSVTRPTMPKYGYGMTHVSIRQQRRFKLSKGCHIRTRLEGVVWCPTTDNGTWLARRNGKVYFTGNSGWGHEDRAFHMVAMTLSTFRRIGGTAYSIEHNERLRVADSPGWHRDSRQNEAQVRPYERANGRAWLMRELLRIRDEPPPEGHQDWKDWRTRSGARETDPVRRELFGPAPPPPPPPRRPDWRTREFGGDNDPLLGRYQP